MALRHEIHRKRNGRYVSYAEDALLYDFNSLHHQETWDLFDVDVPFHREFVDPVGPKTDLFICGVVNKDAIRFSINLLDCEGNIALHFNPRFDQNYVARNCRINGQWGTEEQQVACRNPFTRDNSFELEIFFTMEEFLVSINGVHFCKFAHRVSVSEIKSVEIDGDIVLNKVELNTKDQYPSLPVPDVKLSSSITQIQTPLMYRLKEALCDGNELEIKGRLKLLPWNFYINLQDSTLVWPHPQVGYHLSIRINDPNPSLVLNTWSESGWGREIVAPLNIVGSVLRPGAPFSITIASTRSSFNTKVGGCRIPDLLFSPSIEPVSLRTLYIQGDIYITGIKYS